MSVDLEKFGLTPEDVDKMTPTEVIQKLFVGRFVPENAKDWNRMIKFVVEGTGGGVWWIEVKDQKVSFDEGEPPTEPQITLTYSDQETFYKLYKGELSPTRAHLQKKLKMKGSMRDGLKMGKVFSG